MPLGATVTLKPHRGSVRLKVSQVQALGLEISGAWPISSQRVVPVHTCRKTGDTLYLL